EHADGVLVAQCLPEARLGRGRFRRHRPREGVSWQERRKPFCVAQEVQRVMSAGFALQPGEREVARFRPRHRLALAAALAYVFLLGALYGFATRPRLLAWVLVGALLAGAIVAWIQARPQRILTTRRLVVARGDRVREVALDGARVARTAW